MDDLSQAIQKIGQELYKNVEKEKAEQSEPELKKENPAGEETVEGKYEEVHRHTN